MGQNGEIGPESGHGVGVMQLPVMSAPRPDVVLTAEDVVRAAARIEGLALRTPVRRSAGLDALVGAQVSAKAESLQRTGSFKIRGAGNHVLSLAPDRLGAGLFAASSGNHAQAVAAVAARVGVPATILMPHDAPPNKRAATEALGASRDRVRPVRRGPRGARRPDRRRARPAPGPCLRRPAGDGRARGPSPSSCWRTSGSSTRCTSPSEGVVWRPGAARSPSTGAPGSSWWASSRAAADDTRRSLAAGRRVRIEQPRTIADGLAAPTPGEHTFAVNRRLLDRVEVVSESRIAAAMAVARDLLDLVLEPSGATALAGVLADGAGGRDRLQGLRVGVVLSGGNVTAERFAALVAGGSTLSG